MGWAQKERVRQGWMDSEGETGRYERGRGAKVCGGDQNLERISKETQGNRYR